jgi:hypothetical protein
MPCYQVCRNVFREKVCGIQIPPHFAYGQILISHLSLQPQVLNSYVPQFSNPCTVHHAYGCGGIAMDLALHLQPEVGG